MFGNPPQPPIPCWMGHPNCALHSKTKPDLSDLPPLDRKPRDGYCAFGHGIVPVWVLPRDGRSYCKRHLRVVLRIATFPDTLRFPEDT